MENKNNPTREQIKAALAYGADIISKSETGKWKPGYDENHIAVLSAAYRSTRKPSAIIGRVIGYIIAASLLALACGGLVWAVKMAARMVAG